MFGHILRDAYLRAHLSVDMSMHFKGSVKRMYLNPNPYSTGICVCVCVCVCACVRVCMCVCVRVFVLRARVRNLFVRFGVRGGDALGVRMGGVGDVSALEDLRRGVVWCGVVWCAFINEF